MPNSLQEAIVSNDYYDYIIPSIFDLSTLSDILPEIRLLEMDSAYSLLNVPAPRNTALLSIQGTIPFRIFLCCRTPPAWRSQESHRYRILPT